MEGSDQSSIGGSPQAWCCASSDSVLESSRKTAIGPSATWIGAGSGVGGSAARGSTDGDPPTTSVSRNFPVRVGS